MTDMHIDQEVDEPRVPTRISRIEERIDRETAGATPVSMRMGGLQFKDMGQVMEFSKMMAVSDIAVPPHLRGNPGACLSVCVKALRFGFDPYSLAEHSFVMWKRQKNYDGQWEVIGTISYDSFVFHAIIEGHANLEGPLSPEYIGDGDSLVCRVTGIYRGVELETTSPSLGERKMAIGRNEQGKIKGSPLWDTKPRVQLWYDTRRDWCRMHRPQVLLGMFDRDELEEAGYTRERPPAEATSPNLMARLPSKVEGTMGFSENVVDVALAKEAERIATGAEPVMADAGKPTDAPAESAPTQPTPGPKERAHEPQTAGEYQVYAANWIERGTNADNLEARWDGEKEMRANCKVTVAMRKQIEGMLTAKTTELRTKKRK